MWSLSLSVSVFVCYRYKHLHTGIFVCTLKHLWVGVFNPWVLALCLKTQQSFCTAVPVISKPLSYIVYLFLLSLSLLDWMVGYVQSESAGQRKRQASGWVLAVFRVGAKPWLHDEWPVRRRWQSETHTPPTAVGCTTSDALPSCTTMTPSGAKGRNISGEIL